jgi:hypothetical protein
VRAHVQEQDFPNVQVGQKLTVSFPFTDLRVDGTVDLIDPTLDPQTRSFMLRTTIPNPNGRVKAGAFVKVELRPVPRLDRDNEPRGASDLTRAATIEDRLGALERKVDRILGEGEGRASGARILRRLDALEQKLDHLLDDRKAKSP